MQMFGVTVYIVLESDWKKQPNNVLNTLKEIKNAYDTKTFISREQLLGWQS